MEQYFSYLLNEDIESLEDALVIEKELLYDSYKRLEIKKEPENGYLIGFCRKKEVPEARLLDDYFLFSSEEHSDYSYIYIVEVKERVFVISNQRILKKSIKSLISWDFSLKVALNSDFLKYMTPACSIEFDKEYLYLIDRKSPYAHIKKFYDGKESIQISRKFINKQLYYFLNTLLELYYKNNAERYFKNLKSSTDHQDNKLLIYRDTIIKKKLQKKDDDLFISYPSVKYFDKSEFIFTYGKIKNTYNDMGINEINDFIVDLETKGIDIKYDEIFISQADHIDQYKDKYSLLDLLEFEFSFYDTNYKHQSNTIFTIKT